MRVPLTSFLFIGICLSSYSQTELNNQVDLSGSILTNTVVRFSEIEGAGYAENGEGYRLGFQYTGLISGKLWINTGISFLKASNVYHSAYIGPMEPQVIQSQETHIILVPVRIRYDLLQWVYFKTGITIDYQTNYPEGNNIDNQSGIGFSFLGGLDLKLSESLRFNIEPELGITSIIPIKADDYQQHFLLTGVNFNIGYRF